MAKKVIAEIKLQIPAGQANPSPPVGPALGQRGVNIMAFCKQFNAATQAPPASVRLKRAAGLEKGSGESKKKTVGKVTRAQVEEIAKAKLPDLTAKDLEAAVRTVEGTARSMGIQVV